MTAAAPRGAHVAGLERLVLSAPKTAAQVRENPAALEKGPLSQDEMTWMRDFGRAVHG